MLKFFPSPLYAPDPPGGGAPPPNPTPPNPQPPGGPPAGGLLGDPNNPPPPDPNAPPAALPDNWRDLMAGSEASYAEELGRYKTPAELVKSLVETKKALRTRSEQADPMPDVGDGSDPAKVEALKTWREKHGVPPDPTAYVIPDPVKKNLTDADKPALDSFMTFAHSKGKDQAFVQLGLEWYGEFAAEQEQALADGDAKDRQASEDALRVEWGPDFKRNLDIADRAAHELMPDGKFLEARLPDGSMMRYNQNFIKAMVEVGLSKWGDGAFIGEEAIKSTESRKAEIEHIQRTNLDAYTPALRAEYRAILEAEEKRAGNKR
jgi:hypothetical protein